MKTAIVIFIAVVVFVQSAKGVLYNEVEQTIWLKGELMAKFFTNKILEAENTNRKGIKVVILGGETSLIEVGAVMGIHLLQSKVVEHVELVYTKGQPFEGYANYSELFNKAMDVLTNIGKSVNMNIHMIEKGNAGSLNGDTLFQPAAKGSKVFVFDFILRKSYNFANKAEEIHFNNIVPNLQLLVDAITMKLPLVAVDVLSIGNLKAEDYIRTNLKVPANVDLKAPYYISLELLTAKSHSAIEFDRNASYYIVSWTAESKIEDVLQQSATTEIAVFDEYKLISFLTANITQNIKIEISNGYTLLDTNQLMS